MLQRKQEYPLVRSHPGVITYRNPETGQKVMAAYMAAERGQTIDLTDAAVQDELESYIPLIQQRTRR